MERRIEEPNGAGDAAGNEPRPRKTSGTGNDVRHEKRKKRSNSQQDEREENKDGTHKTTAADAQKKETSA